MQMFKAVRPALCRAAWREAERMDKLRRLLNQGDAEYKYEYDIGWHRNFVGCQGERKAGASSKSNQGASHRNKNRLASRRRRGTRILEGETRQNTRRKEGRPGLLFWMDGWRRSYMRPSGWMEPP